MKYFLLCLLCSLAYVGYSQTADLGVYGGQYWSNRNNNRINQEAGYTFGIELAHNFSEKSQVMFRANYGVAKYYEDKFNDLLQVTTPDTGTNMETVDANILFMYGRNFILTEKFKLNTGAGFGLVFFDYNTRNNLELRTPTTVELLSLTPSDSEAYGFPVLFGGEYSPNEHWSFHIESTATLEPDYGVISIYVGPKISLNLSEINY